MTEKISLKKVSTTTTTTTINNNNDNNVAIAIANKEKMFSLEKESCSSSSRYSFTSKNFHSSYFNIALQFLRETFEFKRDDFINYLQKYGASYLTAYSYFYMLKRCGYIKRRYKKIYRSLIFES